MSRELFGTDGVRGLAGQYPLDAAGALAIGRAVGTHFAQPGESVLIGQDPRESSQQLVDALSRGLAQVGVQVVQAGVLPTPGLAYLTGQRREFVAGVMVTASHNPYQYNGIKVFDATGGKLTDEVEITLNKLTVEGVNDRGNGQIGQDETLINTYEDFLVASAAESRLDGLSIAVDSANGAASGLAERVFRRLGGNVRPLSDSPDGRNINDRCGATDTAALARHVIDEGLAMGVALDGDADRLIMVDEQGREVKGDYLLYILAVTEKVAGVVATVMSNLGFEQALKRQGIELLRTAVGDRYVLEGLAGSGYKLGGEQSGHIIMPELLNTGDGLLAAVQVIKAVTVSGKSLAAWCDEVPLIPQAVVNIPLTDKSLLDKPAVKQFLAEQNRQFAGSGRLLIRPSGTEPLLRVMVEAPEAEAWAQSIADSLKELL